MKIVRIFCCSFAIWAALAARAYGPEGHALVGGVADRLLRQDPAVAGKIAVWLDGISLEEAANFPDKIKSWDQAESPRHRWFHLPDHPAIEQQLWDFWRANPHSTREPANRDLETVPDHHWFHFTDLPVFRDETYAQARTGKSKWDIVHMITYCARVLHGEISEQNDRRITKPVAVILLAHFVGDIHQPLHVGAEYFGANRSPVEPRPGVAFYGDEGGNELTLALRDKPGRERVAGGAATAAVYERKTNSRYALKLHGFWDGPAVEAARREIKARILQDDPGHARTVHEAEYINYLAAHPPAGTAMPASLPFPQWSEAWADEIQPIAREAHQRLEFDDIVLSARGPNISSGEAREKELPETYTDWAGNVVADELAKGGARLAALLRVTVR
jgi:hypothetical protein